MNSLFKFIFFLFFCQLFFISCKKKVPSESLWGTPAVIVGWNRGYCPICGGFYLNLGNNVRENDSTTYYIFHYNQEVSDFVEKFAQKTPCFVQVNWQKDTFQFSPQKIDIMRIGFR